MKAISNKKKLTDSEYFRDYLGSLFVRDYKRVRKLMMERCHISSSLFSNWEAARVRSIPALHKEVLNDIAREHDGRVIFPTDPGSPEA